MTTTNNNNKININILSKPISSFNRFSLDTKKYVEKLHPEYTQGEVVKELSRLWNEDLTYEVKEEYRRRYIIDMKSYIQTSV